MSFAEVLAEIPQLTLEQRREVLHRVFHAQQEPSFSAATGFHAEQVNGRLVLTAPRVILQVEVEAIMEEFP
jgi:hypothetical protein